MKKIYKYSLIVCLLVLSATGCDDYLKEQPRSMLTPQLFETPQGINAALVSTYSGLRTQFCRQGTLPMTVYGTDEFRSTGLVRSADASIDAFDAYGNNLNPDNASVGIPWSLCFVYINTCSGVIERAPASGLTGTELNTLLGEARFLRAFYYFFLVETYGSVPLDLGAGELKHNDTYPSTQSKRNSVAEVLAAIIQDLKEAETLLPDQPVTGRAGKSVAKHFLAKAYLARAGEPTAKQSSDYEDAYTKAKELIDNQALYGAALLEDYGLVNAEGNEHSSEVLFTVEHTTDLTYNEGGTAQGGDSGGENESKENRANFLFTPMYENRTLRPRLDKTDGAYLQEDVLMPPLKTLLPVARSILYQRPWGAYVPTDWLLYTAFADKVNDSRFNHSFRTLWLCNTPVTGKVAKYTNLKDSMTVTLNVGDTALYMPMHEVTKEERDAVPYRIFAPSDCVFETKMETSNGSGIWEYTGNYSTSWWPALKKYDDSHRPFVNYSSLRPFIVTKLSETYLLAAQAALRSNKGVAVVRSYLKPLRDRATYGAIEANRAAATAAMDKELDAALGKSEVEILDFILDEYSRELCGEQWRWIDLKISGRLIERTKLHNENARINNKLDEHHLVRPIPIRQIESMTGENKSTYQNPGY
ncbi:RagB/SusD family nutrient uptake outer membrane protein [termite gut metagenome]|uniref:RagB/SusD family nutrient uptake outer membrane protein n=1 Tax=termite gut metagenome TaxID=433724 RepID=A0A5J4SPM5_9ZZZZ